MFRQNYRSHRAKTGAGEPCEHSDDKIFGPMLSARAYSFKQKSKLAVSLSWIGGYANAVVFFVCGGVFISNMSGNATRFGETLARGPMREVGYFGLIILLFWLGAVA